jgi:hypothetical protein
MRVGIRHVSIQESQDGCRLRGADESTVETFAPRFRKIAIARKVDIPPYEVNVFPAAILTEVLR